MVAIVDYGAGNIKSVENAVRYLGHEAVLTRDPAPVSGDMPGPAAAVREQRGEPRRRGSRYFEGTHSADPGRRGPKSPPDRLERPDLSQSGKAVCGSSGRILCIFCPFILPAGRGSIDRNSVHTVRRTHRRIRGERKRICLPVPPRKERGGRYEDPAEFPDDLIKPAR